VDCISTDSVFCDYCKTSNSQGGRRTKQEEALEEQQREELEGAAARPSGRQIIAQQLRELQKLQECIVKAIGQLQG
jgi:hypothetical protein